MKISYHPEVKVDLLHHYSYYIDDQPDIILNGMIIDFPAIMKTGF